MGTMTMLPQSRALTAADLEAMPDDGHRYELLDGTLIVSPAPSRIHQLVSSRLQRLLDEACPGQLLVLSAPTDVKISEDTVAQPDLLVVDGPAFRDESLSVRPLLAVEILSPSSRLIDLNLKKARYEAAGFPSYWVVDPEAQRLVAWELSDHAYAEVADVRGHESVTLAAPYPVTICPERLLE